MLFICGINLILLINYELDKAYEKFLQNLANVLESGQFSWEKVIDRTCVQHFTAKTATECWNGTSVGR